MRTNVVIDDELMAKAMRVSQLPTKRAVIEAGLQALIRLKAQENIRSLRGKLHWEGDLEAMRTDYPIEIEDRRRAGTNAEGIRQRRSVVISEEREVAYGDDSATQEAP
jgi:Arc/MetJ family transcription regulator